MVIFCICIHSVCRFSLTPAPYYILALKQKWWLIITCQRKITHTWKYRNKISNITAEWFLSNMLPSTRISRAASNADWICRFIPVLYVRVSSTALSLLSDQGLMEIPRQWGMNHIPSSSHFPPWWRRCFFLSHSPSPSSPFRSFTLSPSLESNFTGSSEVAPSHLPKSQLHVVWRCQL